MTRDNKCLVRSAYIGAGLQFTKLMKVLNSTDTLTDEDIDSITLAKDLLGQVQEEISAIAENIDS